MPHPNEIDQDIPSTINRALFHPQATADIMIMNARRNAMYLITAIMHQNATAEITPPYSDIIIMAASTVNNGIIDVEENKSWESLNIRAVPLELFVGKGTEDLQNILDEFELENEGIKLPTQLQWLANPRTIREGRQRVEIAESSVVIVVKGNMPPQGEFKQGIKAAGVWYRAETYTNAGPNSICEVSCRRGHIERKCSIEPACAYSSGHQQTSDHKCNMVGCTANQG